MARSGSHVTAQIARWSRGLAVGIAFALGAAALVVAASILGLQIGSVRNAVTAVIEDAVPGLSIGALGPGIPGRIRLDDVVYAEEGIDIVSVGRIDVDLAPVDLLFGRLHIEDVFVDRLAVHRLPAAAQEPAPATDRHSGNDFPISPLAIRVDRLRIDDLTIDESIAGEAATLDVRSELSADIDGDVRLSFSLLRTDVDGTSLTGSVSFQVNDRYVVVDVEGSEPAGGPFSRLAGLPGRHPVWLRVEGEGPLDGWRGELRAGFDAAPAADLDIRLAIADRIRLGFSGNLNAGSLVPPDMRRLAGGNIAIDGHLAADEDGGNVELAIGLETSSLRLRAEAISPDAGDTIDARLEAALSDPHALEPLIPGLRTEDMNVAATVTGPLETATISVDASATRVSLPELTVGKVAVRAHLASDDWFAVAGGSAVAFSTTLSTAGLSGSAVEPAAPVLSTPMAVTVAGSGQFFDDLFLLSDMDADLPWGTANGELLIDTALGVVSGDIRSRLQSLAFTQQVVGAPVDGRADIRAEFEIGDSITISRLGLVVDGIRTGTTAADTLLADGVRADTSMVVRSDGTIELGPTTLRAGPIRVAGHATLDDDIDGNAEIGLPDISVLEPLAGLRMAGALSANIAVRGRAGDPSATLSLSGSNIDIAGVQAVGLTIEADANRLATGPEGQFEVGVAGPMGAGRMNAKFALLGFETLRLSDLSAQLAGLDVRGNGDIDLTSLLVAGELRIIADDLTAAGAIAAVDMSGRLAADVTLTRALDRQGFRANISGQEMTAAGVSAAAVTGIADVLLEDQGVTVDAAIDVRDLSAPGVAVSRASLTAKGTPERIAVLSSIQGSMAAPFSVISEMTVSQSAEAVAITVSGLDGMLADTPFRLRSEAQVTIAGSRVDADAELQIGDGHLTGKTTFDWPSVSARLSGASLPLAVSRIVLAEPALDGRLDVDMAADLAPGSDVASLRVVGDGLRVAGPGSSDLPPLATRIDARLSGGIATLHATVSGPTQTPAIVNLALPVARQAEGFIMPVHDGALDGSVRWTGDLEEMAQMLPGSGFELTGNADVDLRIGGTVGAPSVTGTANVTDGRYENITTGTLVTEMTAYIVGAENGVLDVRADALDGDTGTVSVTGSVHMASRAVDLSATLANFRALRRDDAEAGVSGTLQVALSDTGGLISGAFEIEPVEIRLLDALPASVPTLDVVDENNTGEPAGTDSIEESPIDLDITVTIPRRAFVRGRGVESEWSGAIAVSGNTAEPMVKGRVEAVRGQVSAMGKTFVIDKGIVELDGSPEIDPVLDVKATTRAQNLDVSLNVSGRVSEPSIEFSSEPPLPRDEVLARLLFGKSTGSLGPAEALALADTVQTLRSGSGGVFDRLRDATGLDVLSASSGEGGPSVTAGKYLADGVFVGVNQGVGPGETSATVEVELTDTIAVQTETGADADSSVGVTWRYDY
ncbi:MAG: translocation/assembly module TamB domain-containing protein [Rhodospirillales bacterium]